MSAGAVGITLLLLMGCALGFYLANRRVQKIRLEKAARKWWLKKIERMCDGALHMHACQICEKRIAPCHDQNRHIWLEQVRCWRTWAKHDMAAELLEDNAEKRLERFLQRNPHKSDKGKESQ